MNLISLSPGDLDAFLCVASSGSFRRGAEALGLSQPAVSARIHHLETILGVRLFERTTRRVTLTEAGERLRERVEPMVGELRDLARSFRDEANLKRGRLRVGASPSVAATFLPDAIALFRRRWPMIELTLQDDFYGRVLDRVPRGEVDMAVIPFESEQDGFNFDPLLTDDHLVTLPVSHELAEARSLTIEQIADLPLITMPPESAAWTTLRRHFKNVGLEFRPAIQTRNTLTAMALVRAGLGVAVTTRLLSTALNMHGLVSRPISGRQLTRQIGIVTAAGRSPSAAVKAMAAVLHEFCDGQQSSGQQSSGRPTRRATTALGLGRRHGAR